MQGKNISFRIESCAVCKLVYIEPRVPNIRQAFPCMVIFYNPDRQES